MISNSVTTSGISFFALLPHWLQFVHFQSWTSSAANHLFKQFFKLATPLSGTGSSIQLRTSFLIDWYLHILHCRYDETLPWYLETIALEELPLRIHAHLVVCYQQIVAIFDSILSYTGYITFSFALCTKFSCANTCSCKFLPSFLTRFLGSLLNDEAPFATHWKISFM